MLRCPSVALTRLALVILLVCAPAKPARGAPVTGDLNVPAAQGLAPAENGSHGSDPVSNGSTIARATMIVPHAITTAPSEKKPDSSVDPGAKTVPEGAADKAEVDASGPGSTSDDEKAVHASNSSPERPPEAVEGSTATSVTSLDKGNAGPSDHAVNAERIVPATDNNETQSDLKPQAQDEPPTAESKQSVEDHKSDAVENPAEVPDDSQATKPERPVSPSGDAVVEKAVAPSVERSGRGGSPSGENSGVVRVSPIEQPESAEVHPVDSSGTDGVAEKPKSGPGDEEVVEKPGDSEVPHDDEKVDGDPADQHKPVEPVEGNEAIPEPPHEVPDSPPDEPPGSEKGHEEGDTRVVVDDNDLGFIRKGAQKPLEHSSQDSGDHVAGANSRASDYENQDGEGDIEEHARPAGGPAVPEGPHEEAVPIGHDDQPADAPTLYYGHVGPSRMQLTMTGLGFHETGLECIIETVGPDIVVSGHFIDFRTMVCDLSKAPELVRVLEFEVRVSNAGSHSNTVRVSRSASSSQVPGSGWLWKLIGLCLLLLMFRFGRGSLRRCLPILLVMIQRTVQALRLAAGRGRRNQPFGTSYRSQDAYRPMDSAGNGAVQQVGPLLNQNITVVDSRPVGDPVGGWDDWGEDEEAGKSK